MSVNTGTVDYGAVIEDLERQRDELDQAIAIMRRLSGQPPAPPSPAGPSGGNVKPNAKGSIPAEIRSDTFFGMKAPEAITRYLAISKGPRMVREIVDGLRKGGFVSGAKDLYNNLYTAIQRMEEAGTVRKLPDGKWGLAEWYPAKPKTKAKSDDAGDKGEDSLADDETAA